MSSVKFKLFYSELQVRVFCENPERILSLAGTREGHVPNSDQLSRQKYDLFFQAGIGEDWTTTDGLAKDSRKAGRRSSLSA